MNDNLWLEQLIRPSRIDMFAQYKIGELYSFGDRPQFTEKIFIDKILGLEETGLKAEAGTAFHLLIEKSSMSNIISHNNIVNGWKIIIPDDFGLSLEVPKHREVEVSANIAGLNIKGRVDSMDLFKVHDIKTTSNYEPEKYIRSYQWKTYLLMTNLERFVYDIFTVKIVEIQKHLTVLDYNKIPLNAYSGMCEEIEEIVTEFKDALLTLKEPIFGRIEEHNRNITNLINTIGNAKSWASNSIDMLNNTIKKLHDKKIILKGSENGN